MNREQIIEMAKEAGLYSGANEFVWAAALERFAALVAAVEREACAKVCDLYTHGQWFAKAIRERSDQDK